jgi:hypothetical protein
MERRNQDAWKYGAALAAAAVFGWFAFVRHVRVPLLSAADLGFHELGHLITYVIPVPEVVVAMAGSIMQIGVPLGAAAYFWFRRRDEPATAFLLAWAATSAQDVSVYIADAPYQRLQLIGGEHDWAWALGPRGFDVVDSAGAIAGAVEWTGFVFLVAAVALCVNGLIRPWRERVADKRRVRRRADLPVRPARPPRS